MELNHRSSDMNRDRFEGIWKQCSGKVKEGWCMLTRDVRGAGAARRDQRAGWIQEGRGISKETIERELAEMQVRNGDWDLTNR
jgi:uncharacterized protein YjbJ (UPF0337 family)